MGLLYACLFRRRQIEGTHRANQIKEPPLGGSSRRNNGPPECVVPWRIVRLPLCHRRIVMIWNKFSLSQIQEDLHCFWACSPYSLRLRVDPIELLNKPHTGWSPKGHYQTLPNTSPSKEVRPVIGMKFTKPYTITLPTREVRLRLHIRWLLIHVVVSPMGHIWEYEDEKAVFRRACFCLFCASIIETNEGNPVERKAGSRYITYIRMDKDRDRESWVSIKSKKRGKTIPPFLLKDLEGNSLIWCLVRFDYGKQHNAAREP
ncbi:unnamed protein product [Larinioides sclopetarius]|uniref:Uncharacterized protein n=1 Tax=Larinioides sclopetarius TaxID=280406 RepID=A0AAV1ZEY0_9ARAC